MSMKPREIALTRFLKSRPCTLLMIAVGVMAVWCASNAGVAWERTAESGLIDWHGVESAYTCGSLHGIINQVLMVGTMVMMGLANRWWNIMRTGSVMYTGLLAIMAGALPALTFGAIGAWIMAVIVLLCMLVMYSCYDRPTRTPRIFLIFFMLSCGTCIEYAFAAYVPVMLLGCGQMRCMGMRQLLAAAIGLLTPLWLLWGFGLIDLNMMQPPHIQPISVDGIKGYALPMVCCAMVTLATGLAMTVYNVIRVYGFNARTRAMNGLLTVLTAITELMCIVDWGRLYVYMPLLLCMTAMQTTLFFRINVDRRGYVTVLALITFYAGIFAWSIIT